MKDGKNRVAVVEDEIRIFENEKSQDKENQRTGKDPLPDGRGGCVLYEPSCPIADEDHRNENKEKPRIEAEVEEKTAQKQPSLPEPSGNQAEQ